MHIKNMSEEWFLWPVFATSKAPCICNFTAGGWKKNAANTTLIDMSNFLANCCLFTHPTYTGCICIYLKSCFNLSPYSLSISSVFLFTNFCGKYLLLDLLNTLSTSYLCLSGVRFLELRVNQNATLVDISQVCYQSPVRCSGCQLVWCGIMNCLLGLSARHLVSSPVSHCDAGTLPQFLKHACKNRHGDRVWCPVHLWIQSSPDWIQAPVIIATVHRNELRPSELSLLEICKHSVHVSTHW